MWQFFWSWTLKDLPSYPASSFPLTSGRETATARRVKPACAVRDEDSRYGIVKDCIKVQEKTEKVVVLGYRLPKNVKLGIFRRGRAITAKKCTKKRDARFASLNQLLFLPFSLTSPWSLLKLSNECSDITVRQVSPRSSQFSLWKILTGRFEEL